MEYERRFITTEVRAVQEQGAPARLVGYAAVFNSWSEDLGGFREKIDPGTFQRAIGEQDIRCLFNHNADVVLGRNLSKTLRLIEDETGLRYEVDLPDTQAARDLYVSVSRGDVTGCSFTFRTVRDEWLNHPDGQVERTLKDVDLLDVGPVTFPAYPETTVMVRSMVEQMRQAAQTELTDAAGAAEKARQQGLERLETLREKIKLLDLY